MWSTSTITIGKVAVLFVGKFLHLHIFEAIRSSIVVLSRLLADPVGISRGCYASVRSEKHLLIICGAG